MRLLYSAVCLALLAALPASAQAPATAPAPDALVDQFIRALPHQEEFNTQPKVDEQDFARLNALNPGREQELRTILMAHAVCSMPPIKDATMRALRVIARDLGTAKLSRLIALYQGADGKILERISDAADKGQAPSDADEREMERIIAAYPLSEWVERMSQSGDLMKADQPFIQALTRCAIQQQAALTRAKLRTQ